MCFFKFEECAVFKYEQNVLFLNTINYIAFQYKECSILNTKNVLRFNMKNVLLLNTKTVLFFTKNVLH